MSKLGKRHYYVTTWDADKQEFTPHKGVRTGPYSLFGLRRAIRKLRKLGYPCDYSSKGSGDPSVHVHSPQAFADLCAGFEAAYAKGEP